MTTKPKTRKAPAPKTGAPKAIPNEESLTNKLTDTMDMLNFAKFGLKVSMNYLPNGVGEHEHERGFLIEPRSFVRLLIVRL
jgi:hypothetical protein